MPHLSRLLIPAFAIVLLLGGLSHAGASEWTPSRVAEGIYALIGPTGMRTAQNDALNCNIGFVVTEQGVVLIDTGTSRMGAERIARAVRMVTDQPIRWVINTGSQDHRWLGNGYFTEQGAKIIALQRTVDALKLNQSAPE
jgi:glyoxylase-like metal-dependent hydrolase (beta-lactamase superfamily II)